MKAKPVSRSEAPAEAASWSIRIPSASRTSADPARDVIARLPCFATGTPPAATTRAALVEMLNVPLPSPPVPTTSIAPSGASTRTTRSRIAASRSRPAPRRSRRASEGPSAGPPAGPASPRRPSRHPLRRGRLRATSVPPSTIVARAARTSSLIGSLSRPRPRGPLQTCRSPSPRRSAPPSRPWRTTR